MCYHSSALTKSALKYAKHRGNDPKIIAQLEMELEKLEKTAYYHASGYSHPKLLVFTNDKPFTPQLFHWGLIPSWCKDEAAAKRSMQQTLNARGETIFSLASFKDSAKSKRCLVYLDAFYEFHHLNKKTFPFRISANDDSPLAVAGLWNEWANPLGSGEVISTFSIVTTTGNSIMAKIHNNPKAEMGPRMPVILQRDKQDEWLDSSASKEAIEALIKPLPENLIQYHTVGKLLGKEAIGNKPEVANEVKYAEIDF